MGRLGFCGEVLGQVRERADLPLIAEERFVGVLHAGPRQRHVREQLLADLIGGIRQHRQCVVGGDGGVPGAGSAEHVLQLPAHRAGGVGQALGVRGLLLPSVHAADPRKPVPDRLELLRVGKVAAQMGQGAREERFQRLFERSRLLRSGDGSADGLNGFAEFLNCHPGRVAPTRGRCRLVLADRLQEQLVVTDSEAEPATLPVLRGGAGLQSERVDLGGRVGGDRVQGRRRHGASAGRRA